MKTRPFGFLLPLLLASCAVAQNAPAATQNSTPSGKTIAERLGYPANSRLLILHADDFGMMHTVDRAIMEAFEKHWINSASILVPCPWFPEVAQWAKAHPEADLGIHVALNADWTTERWPPVSPQPKGSSLLDEDGYLPLTTEYVAAHAKMEDVRTETHAQIDKALAAGIHVSHVDNHMGTMYSTTDLFNSFMELQKAYHVPARVELHPGEDVPHEDVPPGSIVLDQVLEMRPGVPDAQWFAAYKKMLAPLPPGTYQLVLHIAYNDEEIKGATADHPDWGAQWRQNDLDMIRSAEFQKFLKDQGFILVNWRDLAKAFSAN